MNSNSHIISRHIFELTVPDNSMAVKVQNQVSDIVKTGFYNKADKLFSEITSENEVLRVDRLEIDIGKIAYEKLDEEFLSKSIAGLKVQLTNFLNKHRADYTENSRIDNGTAKSTLIRQPDSASEQLIYYLENGNIAWFCGSDEKLSLHQLIKKVADNPSHEIQTKIIKLLRRKNSCQRIAFQLNNQQFLTFLLFFTNDYTQNILKIINELKLEKLFKDGLFASDFRVVALESIFDVNINSDIPHSVKSVDFIKKLAGFIKNKYSPSAQEQFYTLLSGHISLLNLPKVEKQNIAAVIDKTFTKKNTSNFNQEEPGVVEFSSDSDNRLEEISEKTEIEEETIGFDTNTSFAGSDITNNEQTLQKNVVESLASTKLVDYKLDTPTDIPNPQPKTEPKAKPEPESELETKPEKTSIAEKWQKTPKKIELAKDNREEDYKVKSRRVKETETTPEFFSDKTNYSFSTDDVFYIENAGLVLLSPFLPYLFDGLKIIDNHKKFLTEESVFRGIHIMQYLATGQTITPEHELIFNKILCGLDIQQPVPIEIELTNDERDECSFLLSEILERWQALKTKNIDALRANFLQRQGKLQYNSGSWKLLVERNAIDILLDKIPWPFSITKLPWNNELIYTEW
ncbi:MAG: hypothetical protein JXB34_10440 [Bacteroidales bacterium]|nr:hypothetical protein [Bacteroidales bacterium]